MKKMISLVIALALALLGIGVAPVAYADEEPEVKKGPLKVLRMVVLGDSYSAGNGAGDYEHDKKEANGEEGEEKAYRSRNSWGYKYRDWLLNEKKVDVELTVLAHSGDTTQQVLDTQVSKIPHGTDLVMLTIGGNDIGFNKVVEQCFATGIRSPVSCERAVEHSRSIIGDSGPNGLKSRIKKVLTETVERLRHLGRYNSDIVLLGYPNLLLPDSDWYKVWGCVRWYTPITCKETAHYDAGSEILQAAKEFAMVQEEAVVEWLKLFPPYPPAPRPRYITSVPEHFRGHEPNPSAAVRNPRRWINEFFETAGLRIPDGSTTSIYSVDKMEWYHPNKIGHEQIAEILSRELGVPRVVRQVTPSDETANAEPDAELLKPVSAWIQGAYAGRIGQPVRLDARGSYSARGKIATYDWDLDGDGRFDRTTAEPVLTYTWTKEFVGKISLRVTSETGATATTTTEAMITNDGDSTPYSRDNCPEVYNYGQTDYDKDGIGDACDPTPGYPSEDLPGVGEGDPPAPSPSPSPSPSVSPSATASPSPSPSASPTMTPSPTPTKSPSPKPSETSSVTPSPSESPSVTASPTPSASPSLSPSVEPSATAEPTASPSESGSPLPTMTPSASPTESSSPTATAAPTVPEPPTMSPEPTDIPVPTVSPTSAPPVLPSPTSAPAPTTPQPTIPEPPSVTVPSRPVSPDPSRPRPGLPNTGV